MAAPLPTGSSLQALPTAPNVDPTLFAPNALEQLKVAHAGMELGNELARLGDMKAQLDLERAQRKAEMAATEFKRQQVDHATTNLPKIVQAQMAAVAAEQAQNENARALAQAQAQFNVPSLTAQVGGQSATNALSSATADATFAGQPAPARTQALAAAQTLGSWGVSKGDVAAGEVPIAFRENKTYSEIDPITGNTVEKVVTIDKRNGQKIGEPSVLGTTKLGVDEKSVAQSIKDATALVQTKDMASQLDASLDEYIKADAGGLGQAMATNAANSAPTGVVSVIKKAMGAKAQSEATVKVSGEIQALKNTIANALFGSALSKDESANLQGMLPTAEDLTDPKRAKEKLKTTIQFLDTKLRPYKERGILEKANLKPAEPAAPAAPAQASTPQLRAIEDLKAGKVVKYQGRLMRLSTGPDGKPVLVSAE